jgi:TonB family protein
MSAVLFWGGGAQGGTVRVAMGPGVAERAGFFACPPWALASILLAYAAVLLYFAGRIAWGYARTGALMQRARPVKLEGDLDRIWHHAVNGFEARFGFAAHGTEIAESSAISGPVNAGVLHPALLVPPGFLENVTAGDMNALLAHEFAHMARHDFLKNMLYGVLALPISYHPLLWLLRSRLDESRERVCDAMAAEAVAGRESYARSLLRLAKMLSDSAPAGILHAIGIFDANNFERRIMNLTGKRVEVNGARRLLIWAACGAIAVAACTSALALHMGVTEPTPKAPGANRVHVKQTDLKIVHKVQPVYPADAKAAGNTVNGKVELDVIIGKGGGVENIKVSQSLRDDYDQSAIDAVRQWTWEPYLLNGEPVEVETTIQVIYSIGE